MEIRPLKLSGTYELRLQSRHDERGYFMRVYDVDLFRAHDLTTEWVQENQAFSSRKEVVRGLHFQKPPFSETKLVRVVAGAVWDVFVDLRQGFKVLRSVGCPGITSQNQKALYLPRGFAPRVLHAE